MMKDSINTKRLAFAAILTAISVVFLAAAVWLPTGRAACLALAGIPVYLLDLTLRRRWSLLSLAAGTLLTFLFGGMATALAFFLIFGSYPIVKNLLEVKLYKKKALLWFLKFLYFDLMVILLFLLAREVFLPELAEKMTVPYLVLGFIAGNIVFFIADKALGRCGATLFFRLRKYTDQLL